MGLGIVSRYLENAGTYLGAPLSIYLDYGVLRSGRISSTRFTYRSIGTGSSMIGGIMLGSSFGGPWGAIGGTLIGGTFYAGELAYDSGVWLGNETNRQIFNVKKALKHGWNPGR